MPPVLPVDETPDAAPIPRLVWELPSRQRVFFENLRDLVFRRRLARVGDESAPAEFWTDVFVKRGLPWRRFLESGAYHAAAIAAVVLLSHLFAMQPRLAPAAPFDHSQVIYYQPSEYLPPLDTRSEASAQAQKADPAFSPQTIISVPREADNTHQTIVTPPNIQLKHDVAMPNIVAWSKTVQNPRLAIPEAPVTPAAEITRLAPALEASVAAPPDEARLVDHRNSPMLAAPVAAPPSDVMSTSRRPIGDLNIAPSAVVAPAPQLPVAAQRTVPGGGLGPSPQVVPPPTSVSAGGGQGGSFGSRGQIIALSLNPAVGAPPNPPAGNRRGSFAATPGGHAGASGAPGAASGVTSGPPGSGGGHGNGSGGSGKGRSDLPAGLYVGTATGTPSPVAGDPAKAAANSVNPNLTASVRPPRVATSRPMQPESAAKLTESERAIFGDRKFYSVTLNAPNLNSAGGSWVIRFAELNHESGPHEHEADAPPADISQPMATRKVDPAYPAQLMRQNVRGTVILYAVIHADGSVGNVRVLRSVDERLDRFASEAVTQWKFEPATKNGTPVDVEATFQIPFRPSNLSTSF